MYLYEDIRIEISTNTLLAEGDAAENAKHQANLAFQPTPSSRRVTSDGFFCWLEYDEFQPTPSSRRVTRGLRTASLASSFQPTPSSRRVTAGNPGSAWHGTISTNTLLAEGDPKQPRRQQLTPIFQPTPSSRRVTRRTWSRRIWAPVFQPTPSSRRVTWPRSWNTNQPEHFNQHPPRGG